MNQDIDQYLDRLETTGNGKVYCWDCRYLGQVRPRPSRAFFYRCPPLVDAGGEVLRCLHPSAQQTTDTWWGPRDTQQHPAVRNGRNDCPDFRPLHWGQRWGGIIVLLGGLLGVGYLLYWGWLW